MNGRRVATAGGAILADAALVEAIGEPRAMETLFEPSSQQSYGRVTPVGGGRGTAWFIERGSEQWVLRHFRRGGFVARLSDDRYWWAGEQRVRAFAEYRLLSTLSTAGLPVPVPLAARYQRQGLWYRCDLITRRIPNAMALSTALAAKALPQTSWRRVGAAIGRLHRAGADHADLNAHNILIDDRHTVSIVDFDRGRLRRDGAWTNRNLSRLRRSLEKISGALPADRFSGECWQSLLTGYRAPAE
jgi:3-deoxy-D-manno-octulosonic acid kinase